MNVNVAKEKRLNETILDGVVLFWGVSVYPKGKVRVGMLSKMKC